MIAATTRRATMQEAGAELCKALELRGRKKSHRLTVAADLRNHIEPFFEGKDLAKITPQEIERYVVVKRKTLAIKTVRNHLNTMHSVFELGLRRKLVPEQPREARRAAGDPDDRDADQVPRPARAREAARGQIPKGRVRPASRRPST